jgi:hypothetical protein
MARKSRCRRAIRLSRLVALCLGFAMGAAAAHAQISTELSEQAIAVGERVSLLITIDHEEPADVDVPALSFAGVRVVEGPTIRPVSILTSTGRERAVEVRFVLEATAAGRYVLPPTEVRVAGQSYLTMPRLLTIGERGNRSSVPFLARWVGADRSPYIGEAGVYTLEIYNVTDYLYPSSVSLGPAQNAIFEEIQGLGSIDQYTVDGVALYAIPVAVFMVTPSEPGSMRLPDAEIVVGSQRAVAPFRTIVVRELPTAVEQSGAIGAFAYTVHLEPMTFARTETAQVRVRVSGTGNLHFLAIPEPQLTGFVIEREEHRSSIVATTDGYQGMIERVLTVRPTGNERHEVAAPDLVYLNPDRDRILRMSARRLAPTVVEVHQPVDESGEELVIELLERSEIASMERRIWYNDPVAYGWLVPGLLALVISRIWKRRHLAAVVLIACGSFLLTDAFSDRLPWAEIDRGLRSHEQGNIAGAISEFEAASRIAPDSPGINHNLAVLYFQAGEVPRSIFAAREAIRLAPLSDRTRALLTTIERWAGINRTVPPPHLVHPDFFFLMLALLVNALFAGLALSRRTSRAGSIIAGGLVILLVIGALTGLVMTAVAHDQQLGVVLGDVTLQRIPGSTAAGWLPIQSGAAVRVLARYNDSLLVQTVLGLEGWIGVNDLLWPGVPAVSTVRYLGLRL